MLALRGAALTDGDVDPTIGRALELAGYDRDFELLERVERGRATAFHSQSSQAACAGALAAGLAGR